MRSESPEEQENPLNLHSRKGYWKLPVKFIAFFSEICHFYDLKCIGYRNVIFSMN